MCNLLKSSVTFAIVIVKQKKCHEYALKCNVIIFFCFQILKLQAIKIQMWIKTRKLLAKISAK